MRPLINAVVADAGGVCWLCDLPGADSADHEPPRSQLVRLGVPNPDDPIYLRASHVLCNKRRGTRPVTPALKAELKRRRLDDLATKAERAIATANLSPRFAARRPSFESGHRRGRTGSSLPSPGVPEKNDESERP